MFSVTGPNIHLICALTSAGVARFTKRRGSFTAASAREWMESVLEEWALLGNTLEDLVVVCDNAPCHNGLTALFETSPASLLRLGPYSPMLNPVESIWSKIKASVKAQIRVPHVDHPGVGEQRLALFM